MLLLRFLFLFTFFVSTSIFSGEEEKREKIRKESISFFKRLGYTVTKPFPLYSKNLYGKETGYFRYSGDGPDFKDGSVIIQPCVRFEDFYSSKPETLPLFNQLDISSKGAVSKLIEETFKYLINFCKADLSQLGIVSVKSDSNIGIIGLELYIIDLESFGLQRKDILLREPGDAIEENSGSGYWIHPEFPEIGGSTFAIYYFVGAEPRDIKDYETSSDWIEIAEGGLEEEVAGVSFGMERIEKLFFGIPYPDKEHLHKEIQEVKKSS